MAPIRVFNIAKELRFSVEQKRVWFSSGFRVAYRTFRQTSLLLLLQKHYPGQPDTLSYCPGTVEAVVFGFSESNRIIECFEQDRNFR